MGETVDNLRGLVLSAVELHEMNPTWTNSFIEDYLSVLENIFALAEGIDAGVVDNRTEGLRSYFYGRVY